MGVVYLVARLTTIANVPGRRANTMTSCPSGRTAMARPRAGKRMERMDSPAAFSVSNVNAPSRLDAVAKNRAEVSADARADAGKVVTLRDVIDASLRNVRRSVTIGRIESHDQTKGRCQLTSNDLAQVRQAADQLAQALAQISTGTAPNSWTAREFASPLMSATCKRAPA